MEIKFFKFLILAILAVLFLPNFCRTSETQECYQKFIDDPMYQPFDTMLKTLFEAIGSVLQDVSLSKILKYECISYSLTQKAVDSISSALDMINKKNCSAVKEIKKLEEDAVSAAVDSVKNVYLTMRNLCEPYPELGKNINDTEKNAINHITTSFRCFFNEMKIVLTEICPGNLLIKIVNNALDLLKTENDEAKSKIINLMDETINLSADIHVSFLKLHQSNSKNNSLLFETNRKKSGDAFAQVFQSGYESLKNCLPKS